MKIETLLKRRIAACRIVLKTAEGHHKAYFEGALGAYIEIYNHIKSSKKP